MGPVGELVVRECRASEFADCDVVFSGLDSDVAGEIGAPHSHFPPPRISLYCPSIRDTVERRKSHCA